MWGPHEFKFSTWVWQGFGGSSPKNFTPNLHNSPIRRPPLGTLKLTSHRRSAFSRDHRMSEFDSRNPPRPRPDLLSFSRTFPSNFLRGFAIEEIRLCWCLRGPKLRPYFRNTTGRARCSCTLTALGEEIKSTKIVEGKSTPNCYLSFPHLEIDL